MSADLLANAERADKPRHIPPPLPDLPDKSKPWHGSAGAEVQRLRNRIAQLEAEVARLRSLGGEP